MDSNTKPRLSIVTVSDYEASEEKSWNDERKIVLALSQQDIEEPFELILVESQHVQNLTVPKELYQLIPNLIVVYADSLKSAELKELGISKSKGKYVAVLESDCVPSANWLRTLLESLESGEYAAASGRTFYGETSSYRRVMNLLHRSWDDPGFSCSTDLVSNNGAIYHRGILEKFPYPDAATPFLSAEMRNNQIRLAGHIFFYERNVTMQHAIGGLGFIWDFQRNKGHQDMSLYKSKKIRSIFRLALRKTKRDFSNIRHLGKRYLKWYDWPLLPFLMVYEILPYMVGCSDAIKNVKQIPGSAYR